MSAAIAVKCVTLLAGSSLLSFYSAKSIQPKSRPVAATLLLAVAGVLVAAAPYLAPLCESVLVVQGLTCILGCCSFKVAALAMGRGALAREIEAGCDLWRFFGVLSLPVIPTTSGGPRVKNKTVLVATKLQTAILKISAFAAVSALGMLALYGVPGSEQPEQQQVLGSPIGSRLLAIALQCIKPLLFFVSGVALWLEVDGMGDLVDALALALFDITAEPHFRFPFVATSLAEFWSRRWNLTMSSMLRDLVFHPICENSFFPRGSSNPRGAATSPLAVSPNVSLPGVKDTSSSSGAAASAADANSGTLPSVDERAALQQSMDSTVAASTGEESTPLIATGTASTTTTTTTTLDAATTTSAARAGAVTSEDGGVAPVAVAAVQMMSEQAKQQVPDNVQQHHHHHQRVMSSASLNSSTGGGFESDAGSGVGGGAVRRSRSGASHMRKFLASCATFTVSGVWHELVFAHLTGGATTRGVWTMYFLLQAPMISLETSLHKRAAKAGVKLPPWAAITIITLLFSFFVSVFWIPPMMWPLPTTCPVRSSPADTSNGPAGLPVISVFDHIRLQGARDLGGVLQLLAASGTMLSNTLFGGLAVQEVMTRVLKDTRQLVGSLDVGTWLRQVRA